MSTDPLGLAGDVARSTARLLAAAAALDDDAVAAPSLLPGWRRGHVLTHLARNADGAWNLLYWARTGNETPQYRSAAHRAADIEAGAYRPAAEQLADLTAACQRLAEAVDDLPVQAWSYEIRWTNGRVAPAADVMWSRLRELEIHQVDLDTGFTAADWPEAFTARMARALAQDLGQREDGPRVVIRSAEVGHDLVLGDGTREPVVSGPLWAAVAWLLGRPGADRLTVDPPGSLPVVPPFS